MSRNCQNYAPDSPKDVTSLCATFSLVLTEEGTPLCASLPLFLPKKEVHSAHHSHLFSPKKEVHSAQSSPRFSQRLPLGGEQFAQSSHRFSERRRAVCAEFSPFSEGRTALCAEGCTYHGKGSTMRRGVYLPWWVGWYASLCTQATMVGRVVCLPMYPGIPWWV